MANVGLTRKDQSSSLLINKMNTMTSRERLITALKLGVPDRVPVTPDLSNMIPCRYTGKPFWEIYVNQNPPLWKARLDVDRKFYFDTILNTGLESGPEDPESETKILSKEEDQWTVERIIHAKKGDLTTRTIYPRHKSPWVVKPLITDPETETDALLSTLTDPWKKDASAYEKVRKRLGDGGITAAGTAVPLAWWLYSRRRLDTSVLDFYDRLPLVERAMQIYEEWALEFLKATCERIHPDLIMFSGSVASMSVVSPDLYRRYAFPFLRRASELARSRGVYTGVHMCGKSKDALSMIAEAGIDLIEPLEAVPGGDINLPEVKSQFGNTMCLKGNINTFQTLVRGTPEKIEAEVKQCIEDASAGGGFILSTGDQVAVDTPEENLVSLQESAKTHGVYH